MSVELVYETHATTTDNERAIATGWLPGQLSEEGVRNAIALGARRRNDGISLVYVSDLKRALDTVAIAFDGIDLPIISDQRLRECNYGTANGMPTAQLEVQRLAHIDRPWPGGESYRDVVGRMARLLADIQVAHFRRRVLLVGHSANKWALDHLILRSDLAASVAGGMAWQPGWEYVLPDDWSAQA